MFNDFNREASGQDYRAANFVTTLNHAAKQAVLAARVFGPVTKCFGLVDVF